MDLLGNQYDASRFRSDRHHPLTLLSFLSKNGDEPSSAPIGKRPNRSLPSILYRPRRLIEIEATAAEKAKKEQLDKVLFHVHSFLCIFQLLSSSRTGKWR